jgi:hypothetical protein
VSEVSLRSLTVESGDPAQIARAEEFVRPFTALLAGVRRAAEPVLAWEFERGSQTGVIVGSVGDRLACHRIEGASRAETEAVFEALREQRDFRAKAAKAAVARACGVSWHQLH